MRGAGPRGLGEGEHLAGVIFRVDGFGDRWGGGQAWEGRWRESRREYRWREVRGAHHPVTHSRPTAK